MGEEATRLRGERDEDEVRLVGRYALHRELASGGMAAVHLGRLLGPVGFSRTVAIKRLHSRHARDPEFVAMFLDEARLVSRIRHPNVVPTLDVVTLDGEVFLVMEYVHGAPVSKIMMALVRRKEQMPINIAVGITIGMLEGLHAAHEAKSEDGVPLGIVHRDVSPQNVIVGSDGVARVLDFGIAKAAERLQVTEDGSFKGKLGYMPPDVLQGSKVDRRADVWGAAVVLWEMLAGKRLFHGGESPHSLVRMIVEAPVPPPARAGLQLPSSIEAVVMRALEKDPEARYPTARDMASALEDAASAASGRVIAEWLGGLLSQDLEKSAAHVEEMERASRAHPPSIGTVRSMAESGNAALPAGPLSSERPVALEDPPAAHSVGSEKAPAFGSFVPDPVTETPVFQPRPRGRGRTGRVLGLLLFAVTATLIGVVALRPAATTRAGNGAVDTGSASVSVAPPPRPSPSAPASVTAVTGTLSSAPSAVSSSPPHPPATRPVVRPQPPPKSCSPPYTIGPPPDYIRKPKLECLPR